MIIKRLGPLSCARVAGVVYALIGLLLGGLVSIFALLGAALSSAQRTSETVVPPILGAALGVGAIIIFPIIYGTIGFLFALFGAWLYNLVAGRVGGVEIDLS